MDFKTSLNNIFSPRKHEFSIPNYQRAYSWEVDLDENKQVKQFIADLEEQPEHVPYFLGHFLFEKDSANDNKYWIIDGQQRITTVILFFSCLVNRLKEIEGHEKEIKELTEDYLINGDVIKFRTVEYDDNFFQNITLRNTRDKATTKSKKRILEAVTYFNKIMSLEKTTVEKLLSWKKIIESARITTDVVNDKTEATQLFTFQNDRGKDLTELEKLKAFLMFNTYLSCKESGKKPDDLIRYIEKEFETIYETLENITILNEDQILSHHVVAFMTTSGNALETIKISLIKEKEKEDWIRNLAVSLKNSYLNVKEIQDRIKTRSFIADVIYLDAYNSFPLLLKLYHFHASEIDKCEKIFRLMEIILFRMEFTTGNYRTNRFHYFALHYKGNLESYTEAMRQHANNGFQPWWRFQADFDNCLKGNYHYWNITKYLLWKYENKLRDTKRDQPMLYTDFVNLYSSNRMENTIDHWMPQNPENIEHSEEFKEKYLHNIGNLVLATRGRNSSDSNKLPSDRDSSSILLSRQELEPFKSTWSEKEIKNRQENIVRFALAYWNPENVI